MPKPPDHACAARLPLKEPTARIRKMFMSVPHHAQRTRPKYRGGNKELGPELSVSCFFPRLTACFLTYRTTLDAGHMGPVLVASVDSCEPGLATLPVSQCRRRQQPDDRARALYVPDRPTFVWYRFRPPSAHQNGRSHS